MDRSNPAWTVPSSEEGSPLRSFLKLQLKLSNKEVARLIDDGKVQVNGRREQFGSRRIKRGEKIKLLGAPVLGKAIPKPTSLNLLHEDDELLVINKDPGLPSQITRDPKRVTIEGLVNENYHSKRLPSPTLLHRLDRDTSGVLLFGKTNSVSQQLMDWFRHRKIHKTYLAICEGIPRHHTGTWTHHIGPSGKRAGKTFHTCLRSGGQKAVTDYRVLATGKGLSLWELKPHTGRTHQLRVQCAEARHPIFGDHFYGAKSSLGRHLLHAAHLSLPDEFEGSKQFLAPLQPDFIAKLREMGNFEHYEDWSRNLIL